MDRTKSIIKFLLEKKAPVTINEIATELNVSNKTVRNDLKNLQDIVEREGLKVQKKTGIGTSIEGPEDNKAQLLLSIKRDLNYIEPFSRENRQYYILRRLFMSGSKVTAQVLADELYVCSATIHKDLEQVEKWVNSFNLKLIRKKNYGIEICGNENDYRKAISCLLAESREVEELKELLYTEYKGRIDYQSMLQLKALFKIDFRRLEDILNYAESKLKYTFSQEAYTSLFIHIVISIKRIQEGKDILLSPEMLDSIKNEEEYRYAREICLKLQEHFKIKIPEPEVGYITLHLLGCKMQEKDLGNLTVPFEKLGELELAVGIARTIVKLAEDTLSLDFSKDKHLLNGLILHLRPTINRLKYGLTLRNPFLEEIKTNYPDIFGVAWMSSTVFEKYLDVRIPESEIGYIAMHIGAAAERQRKSIKTLVICHSGIGTSQLLSARLARCFKEIEVMGVVSAAGLTENMISGAELIISTVPLNIKRPVLLISPLLTQQDIKKIELTLSADDHKTAGQGQEKVAKEVYYRSIKFANREQVIEQMCSSLEKKQYIKKGFKQSVIERENYVATEIGNFIAIPHGEPGEVMKSCLALTVLEQPLKWDKEKVQFIFMICLAEKDMAKTKTLLKNLYSKMDSPQFLMSLKKGTVEEAKRILDTLES